MNRIRIVVAAIALATSGCATGVGCAAGAITGASVATAASLKQAAGVETVGYMAGGALFGAITGCVAGFFAGNRATAIERERTQRSNGEAAPARSSEEAP